MRNLTLVFNREEAQQLLNCLVDTNPKFSDLNLKIEVENLLINYLKITDNDHISINDDVEPTCKHCGRRDRSTMCKLFPAPCKDI